MKNLIVFLLLITFHPPFLSKAAPKPILSLSLNGEWEIGFSRNYNRTVTVPSIAEDPKVMRDEVLWYKKEVKLPKGDWTSATLVLNGARFMPKIYINGELVAQKNGGMAPIFVKLNHKAIKPKETIVIEIALASLKKVPSTDASFIPWADHWRSNVSSGLWDDVTLNFHREASIDRIIPFINQDNETAAIDFDLISDLAFKGKALLKIVDNKGKVLITASQSILTAHTKINFSYQNKLKLWSPDQPNLYKLQLSILDAKGRLSDHSIIPFAIKKFEVKDKQFYLNNQHFVPKGATVVWHRWMRTEEGRALGYDTTWFKKNIIQRTKDLGGNYLRFHLGVPPEKFLDLCDEYGLVVQFEWSFFHGMPASKESLVEQYKNWLDLAMRHPSVSLIHPYNETGGDQLKIVWAALDELLPAYPPLVLEDRDVIHIHKYWWSLFENVGLFYDQASVFPKAIMVDEFGGNYLDENGDLGSYSTVKETYMRFLGRSHNVSERLALHTQANAKIAEYWRRIGAAGFSPFCALGSKEDGNSWFLGPLKDGNPKPVWEALAASFSPQSVSIELWDKNFEQGQLLKLPVYLFNEESKPANLQVKISISDSLNKVFYEHEFKTDVAAFNKKIEQISVQMPSEIGNYIIKAELLNKPEKVKYPVVSSWDFRVIKAKVPEHLKNIKVGVADDELEIKEFLVKHGMSPVKIDSEEASIILTSLKIWDEIAKGNESIRTTLYNAIEKGKSVVMLDVGERPLGQGYPKVKGDFGPLQGVVSLNNPKANSYKLFGGVSLKFTEAAEPESYLHPDLKNNKLWYNLSENYTGIFNGLRGGLIVPAMDMELIGLSANAYLTQWKSRGANEGQMASGSYYAYELQGFYEFSTQPNDAAIKKKLKDKVIFLVQDAPALSNTINPESPIVITNLNKAYQEAKMGLSTNLVPLANCGKNLTRTPVSLIEFGDAKGKLLVSQLLTSGRLAKGYGETGLYGIRYDEVAVQYVLNMLNVAIKKD